MRWKAKQLICFWLSYVTFVFRTLAVIFASDLFYFLFEALSNTVLLCIAMLSWIKICLNLKRWSFCFRLRQVRTAYSFLPFYLHFYLCTFCIPSSLDTLCPNPLPARSIPEASTILQTPECSEYHPSAPGSVVCSLSFTRLQLPGTSSLSVRHAVSDSSFKSSLKTFLFSKKSSKSHWLEISLSFFLSLSFSQSLYSSRIECSCVCYQGQICWKADLIVLKSLFLCNINKVLSLSSGAFPPAPSPNPQEQPRKGHIN